MNGQRPTLLIMRSVTALTLSATLGWLTWAYSPIPLLLALGLASALIAIRAGQQSEVRYGRRIPVTEMLSLGRQGDRQLLLGGIAGYLMIIWFGLALWLAI